MTLRLLRSFNIKYHWRSFHTTGKLSNFYESDRKSGYPHISDYKIEPKGQIQRIREGWQFLKEELALAKEELFEKLRMDPVWLIPPGEVDVHWKFDGDPKTLNKFIVTSDSDMLEGHSFAK